MMEKKARLLIVEDEKVALKNLQHVMEKEGYDVTGTTSGTTALSLVEKEEFDLVLTDLRMPKVDGLEVLKRCRELHPDLEVIMITAYATVPSAVETMKKGAYHFIPKPFRLDEVRQTVREALEKARLKRENRRLREEIEKYHGKVRIITQNRTMRAILDTARQVAPTDANVIISGESGTGKELLARFIHEHSTRRSGPFFAINCGAFTEELLSNELFGHEKGAFTGAVSMKKGLVEMGSEGTLFLDEITEMSPPMQVRLLRVIQERELLRLGATEPRSVNVRFIAAANRDLQESQKDGTLRQDLYYRLNVMALRLPPLVERLDDIPLLCQGFLRKYATLAEKEPPEMSPEALAVLMSYDFPGNVRELENIIERGVALAREGRIEVAHLPEDLINLGVKTFRKVAGRIPTLEEQETAYIHWVLQEAGGNKTLAAQILGIDRVSLWRKLKKQENNL
jgi:DNA-binding NtrC family response regulator